jgi:hypothetical protein
MFVHTRGGMNSMYTWMRLASQPANKSITRAFCLKRVVGNTTPNLGNKTIGYYIIRWASILPYNCDGGY